MPTGLTYTTYQNQIATMAAIAFNTPSGTTTPTPVPSPTLSVNVTDANFQNILPSMIDYAELRIYRDLDLLASVQTATATLSTTTRQVSFPQFVTVQQINVITPYGTTNPDLGTRVSLVPVTKEFLDIVYPSASTSGVPSYFAPLLQNSTDTTPTTQTLNTFLVGPFPNNPYTVEIVGTYRPPTLSSANITTFITENLPDLFIMASMVYISAYQRNFGRINDDPNMAQTYESQYQSLMKAATVEEFRKKFQSAGWTSVSPSPVATPTRG